MKRWRKAFVALLVCGACKSFHVRGTSGGDGGPGSDGGEVEGSGRFCAAHASSAFCDDFDQGEVGASWTKPHVRGQANVSLDSADPVSPPYAFSAKASPHGDNVEAWLERQLGASPVKVVVETQIRIDRMGDLGFNAVVIHRGSGDLVVSMYSEQETVVRQESEPFDGGAPPQSSLATPIPSGGWHALRVEADYGGARIHVDVDGTPALDIAMVRELTAGADVWVGVGIVYATGTSDVSARFDDVVVTTE